MVNQKSQPHPTKPTTKSQPPTDEVLTESVPKHVNTKPKLNISAYHSIQKPRSFEVRKTPSQ